MDEHTGKNYVLLDSEEINKILSIDNKALPYEIWITVNTIFFPRIEKNKYYVSSYGRVFSSVTKRLKTPELSNVGYYRVHLADNSGNAHHYSIHRLVLCSFFPIQNCENLEVNHKDGNKLII